MNTLKILLVEDDKAFAIQMEAMLDSLGYTLAGKVANYQQAIAFLNLYDTDLIITDVILAGRKTGIELAQEIKHRLIPILFITAFQNQEYYQQAKEIPLSGYLIKPFYLYSLDSHLRILAQQAKSNIYLRLDNHSGDIIRVEDIVYIDVDNTYTFVHTTTKKAAYKKSLTQLMKELPTDLFLSIHRRYAVSKRYIERIDFDKSIVILKDNIQLPISRRMKQHIKENLQILGGN